MKKITLLLLAFALVFVLAGCGAEKSEGKSIEVKLSITYPEGSNVKNVSKETVSVNEGDSVLDTLQKYADTKDFKIEIDNKSAPYVVSINGVEASGNGGWVYDVNGNTVMDPADSYKVVSGENYNWSYTTW